ncbi:MAG: hypothetical protein CM1200mP30_21430 [Pseudomonadota bacterium]|nr:MAG: hypothetical protein CM1200mP30_21430 [Pseudomonadota bacterium]
MDVSFCQSENDIGYRRCVLLNAKLKGERGAFRVLVMPPWIVPMAIGCIGWLWVFNGHFGFLQEF